MNKPDFLTKPTIRPMTRAVLLGAALLAAHGCGKGKAPTSGAPSDSLMIAAFEDHRIEFELLKAQALLDMKRCKRRIKKSSAYEAHKTAKEDAASAAAALKAAGENVTAARAVLKVAQDAGAAIAAAEKVLADAIAAEEAAIAKLAKANDAKEAAEAQVKFACNLSFDASDFENRTPKKFLGYEQTEAYVHLTKAAGLEMSKIEADDEGVSIIAYEGGPLSGNLRKGFYFSENDISPTLPTLDLRAGAQNTRLKIGHRLIERQRKKLKPDGFKFKNWYLFQLRAPKSAAGPKDPKSEEEPKSENDS